MTRNHMQYDVRKARIYREAYRPNPFRFFVNLLSIILLGQSQVGGSAALNRRAK
ncbi:hypothetical protein ACQ86N_44245 [Puia sp. P3]|uniref:hypothetical protein n=1 Tax=Puia sp. P3 TaxID=3423952 RepID=UPI003D667F98